MQQPKGFEPGFYKVHWKDGKTSIAVIGITKDGTNWHANVEWRAEDGDSHMEASTNWSNISGIRLLPIGKPSKMEDIAIVSSVKIIVQDDGEPSYEYDKRINTFLSGLERVAESVQLTSSSNGRQTCNIIYREYVNIDKI